MHEKERSYQVLLGSLIEVEQQGVSVEDIPAVVFDVAREVRELICSNSVIIIGVTKDEGVHIERAEHRSLTDGNRDVLLEHTLALDAVMPIGADATQCGVGRFRYRHCVRRRHGGPPVQRWPRPNIRRAEVATS